MLLLAGAAGVGAAYACAYDIFFVVDGNGVIRYRGPNGIWNANAVRPVVDQALADLLVPVEGVPERDGFSLLAAYPNPFNPSTTIPYRLQGNGEQVSVQLRILDIRGRLIRTLVAERQATGEDYKIGWNGHDDSGQRVPSGTYLVDLNVAGKSQARFLTLVK